jgi:hypothetical protein
MRAKRLFLNYKRERRAELLAYCERIRSDIEKALTGSIFNVSDTELEKVYRDLGDMLVKLRQEPRNEFRRFRISDTDPAP